MDLKRGLIAFEILISLEIERKRKRGILFSLS
jgi:hypothetical protein